MNMNNVLGRSVLRRGDEIDVAVDVLRDVIRDLRHVGPSDLGESEVPRDGRPCDTLEPLGDKARGKWTSC